MLLMCIICAYFSIELDSTTVISNLTTANSSTAFHDSTRLPSKTSGHCFETNAKFQSEDVDTATSFTMVRNLNTRNVPFHIRSYRKVQTFRGKNEQITPIEKSISC